ncbi:cytochrome P450 [Boletus coccyginus]|nr:cytochrome P450 [Boletus coccyginus]
MTSGSVAAWLTALVLLCALFRRLARPSLSKIRGPKSSSFLLGNLLELFQRPVGQADFEWQNLYGNVVRFKTVFGTNFWSQDPKALQWIFNTSAYRYPKQPNLRVISRMMNGKGVIWADGDDHKRQRKVLLPGFGDPESKAFLRVFKECAESMCMKWMEKAVFNVPAWLSRGALDAIGQAAFDVQKYNNTLSDVFGRPSAQQIFIQAASMYFPPWILEWVTDHGPGPRLERAREVKKMATEVAKEMVREKAETLLEGKGSRDVFSLLVKANMDMEARNRLTEEELLAQMRTILFAGHETTSNSLSWILLELARHPKMQSRLRGEVREMEAAIRARGDTQFTMADFDAMPYTSAVIKEGLRYHPVIPHVQRVAGRDDILPLSRPITTESGGVISEIVVPKGTRIVASIAAYNRNPELWGDNAHEFNPDRWLDGVASEKKPVSIVTPTTFSQQNGRMTFIGGVRACLGWRFAVIEIQAFIVEIVGKFEFTMTDQSERVCRAPSFVMIPMVDGELERGSQLPLAVSVAARQDDV